MPRATIIDEYIRVAMKHAHLECVDGVVAATVPEAFGLVAMGASEQDCLDDLRARLEDWARGRLANGELLPVIDGIDLDGVDVRPPAAQNPPSMGSRRSRSVDDEAQLESALSRWERDG